MKIALVTDSTADLPQQLLNQWKIFALPLKVSFGHQQYLDCELTSEEFYTRLAAESELPKTSQPSPEDFASIYARALAEYDEVISVHVSSGLSGTLNSAHMAAEKFAGKVHLVDSRSISLGIGQQVLEAAKGIQEGLTVQAVLDRISMMRDNMETIFTLDTLEYLHKGGRIGAVKGLLGSLLRIKPVIRVNEEGVYVPAGIARSREKALCGIVSALEHAAVGRTVKALAIAHGAAKDAAEKLQDKLESVFNVRASLFTQVGPVIGVHTGPGTVGASIVFA
ncbi:MAG: DegV family protein [Eubacteriales bacterium]|nr:DegV family protein [Eubacteriales bacterium]MDD3073295.1 DegV family protein [Eubacteriales bacterium]MDD4078649.1 DegV family protein [Eubacteriales bacterium]MDD4769029.1 DegV family protein [Eubacteriales bacterium]